jgi:tape measure domain-containing protein
VADIFELGVDHKGVLRAEKAILKSIARIEKGFAQLPKGIRADLRKAGNELDAFKKKLGAFAKPSGGRSGKLRVGRLDHKSFTKDARRILEDIEKIRRGLKSITGTFGPRLRGTRIQRPAAPRPMPTQGMRVDPGDGVGAFGVRLRGISPAAMGAAAAVGVLSTAIIGSGSAALRASNDYQRWLKTLEFGTGSMRAAHEEMAFIEGAADDLGLNIGELSATYSRWTAITKGTALEGQETRDVFEATARAASVMGLSTADTTSVMSALGQVLGKGRLSAEEYRQQIGERLPIAMRAFVEASGLTEAAFIKQMEQGKILSADILPKYDDALRRLLGDAGPAETAERAFTRVRNQIFLLAAAIGDELNPIVSDLLNSLAETLRESRPFVEFWASEGMTALQAVGQALAGLVELNPALRLIWEAVSQLAGTIAPVSRLFAEIGGFSGAVNLLAAAGLEAAASMYELAGSLVQGVLGGLSAALEGLADFVTRFRDVPGMSAVLDPLADGLADVGLSLRKVGEDAKGSFAPTAKSLRLMADKRTAAAAKSVGKEIGGIAKEVKKLGTAPAPEQIEKISRDLQALEADLESLEMARELMDEFGISAEEAKKAVAILTSEGIKPTRGEVVALVKAWKAAGDALKGDEIPAAVRAITSQTEDLRTAARLIEEFGVSMETAADAARLMREANIDAASALDLVRQAEEARREVAFQAFQSGEISEEDYRILFMTDEQIELMREAEELIASTATAQERYRMELMRLDELARSGLTEEAYKVLKLRLEVDLNQGTAGAVNTWTSAIGSMSGMLDGSIANFASAIGEAGDVFSSLTSQDMSTTMAGFAAGATLLSGIFQFQGPPQTGALGGRSSGDYSQEGQAIGSALGAIWGSGSGSGGAQAGGSIGGLIGQVVGGAIEIAAEEAIAQFDQSMDDLHVRILADPEGLATATRGVAEGVLEGVERFEDLLNAELDFSGNDFRIQLTGDDEITVWMNGVAKVFNDVEEAINFGITQIIRGADVSGLGEHAMDAFLGLQASRRGGSTVLRSLPSPEEVQELFTLASAMDAFVLGTGPAATAFDDLQIRFKKATATAAEFGLDIGVVMEMFSQEVLNMMDSLTESLNGLYGVQDRLAPIMELQQAAADINAGIADEEAKRVARLEELRRREASLAQGQSPQDMMRGQEEAAAQLEQTSETVADGLATVTTAVDELGEQVGETVYQAAKDNLEQQAEVAEAVVDNFSADAEILEELLAGGKIDTTEYEQQMQLLIGNAEAAAMTLEQVAAEIAALEEAADALPEAFDMQAIADGFTFQASQAGLDLLGLLSQIEGFSDTTREGERLKHDMFMIQLAAQIASVETLLAATGLLNDSTRALVEGILARANQALEGLASGSLRLRGGGGRRRQEREEAERAAEEAERALEEFSRTLRILEGNAASSSGTLGDLADRLREIAEAADEALEAGADPADVQRAQQLQLREEAQDLLDPFSGPENFATRSEDIERMRRDAIARAELIAQAQAELLGIPFEAVFDSMADTIDRGAARMQAELTRSMIDALGLPLEQTRRQMQGVRQSIRDLNTAFRRGDIDASRHASLIRQVQAAHEAALSGDVLGMLDQYYEEVEGREELRRDMEIARFELELANARIRFDFLVAEGALTDAAIERIGGFLDFMESNPPDWDSFFDTSDAGAFSSASASMESVSAASTDLAGSLDALLDAMHAFIDDFEATGVGRFEAQARSWIDAVESIDRDLEDALEEFGDDLQQQADLIFGAGVVDITDLTDEQAELLRQRLEDIRTDANADAVEALEDLLEALDLSDQIDAITSGQAAGRLLDMYRGTIEESSQLATELAAINAEYLDIVAALELIGGSAEELAEAEAIHQERLEAFWESALQGVRDLETRLRGADGGFGGPTTSQAVTAAQERFDAAAAAYLADPNDLEALQELEAAGAALTDLMEGDFGAVGGEFAAFAEDMLAILGQIQPPPPSEVPAVEESAAQMVDEQRAATIVLEGMRDDQDRLLTELIGEVRELRFERGGGDRTTDGTTATTPPIRPPRGQDA